MPKILSDMASIVGRLGSGSGRLVLIAGVGFSMIAVVVAVALRAVEEPRESRVAKMPQINLLPGGTQSNPAQDALLLEASREKAKEAETKGVSYTPPMPASLPLVDRPVVDESALKFEPVEVTPRREARIVTKPVPPPPMVLPEPKPVRADPPRLDPAPRIQKISSTVPIEPSPAVITQQEQAAMESLFEGFGRPPRTDILLVPGKDSPGIDPTLAKPDPARQPIADRPIEARTIADREEVRSSGKVLVPAGRGIFAHTVVGVNSDAGGPVILEADSGPLAGDRMIGNFTKATRDRIVVRVTSIEHRGQSLDVNGLVVAPDTMETAVASSVDQHYFERFVFPGAAAFVEGLGEAVIAANSTTTITPFGGTITQVNRGLNLKQTAAVAAGAAASEIGSVIRKDTPKIPTIYLAANVTVGVMFLQNVTLQAKGAR